MIVKSAKTNPASGIEISILVPVMNESGNIAPLVDEICAALAGRSFEIIYVDDASNDDSPAELAATAARVPQLRVLRHEVLNATAVHHLEHRVHLADGRGQAQSVASTAAAIISSRLYI